MATAEPHHLQGFLRDLLGQPEGETLEFKRNVPKDVGRIAEVAVAFANTAGGTLVVGFDEPSRTAVGLANVERDLVRIEYELRSIRPGLRAKAEHEDLDGKALIVVRVPKGPHFPYRSNGRVLQRVGSRNAPISTELAIRRAVELPTDPAEERNLAEAIAEQSQAIERLRAGLGWRRQLPLQLVFLVAGTVLGYALGGWNPIGFG